MQNYKFGDAPFKDWELIPTEKTNWRFYINKKEYNKDGNGFDFHVADLTSYSSNTGEWADDSEYINLWHGTCLFDGLRHLYYGDIGTDEAGYVYYPNLKDHIKILEKLQELIKLYCSQADE